MNRPTAPISKDPTGSAAVATPTDHNAPAALRPVHYVLSSHWDREWHQPFEVFRYELIELIDRVLDAIAADELRGPFYCDGQSIVLEDYLEVRPERREELVAALKSRAIVAGPWYVLADELLVSGESLIRNLRIGREQVRRLGVEPSNTGFLCDLFGHIGQMPQLLKSFDVPAAYLWRGVNLHEIRQFNWTGSDGTTLPCHRFGTNGYWGFAVNIGQFTNHREARDDPEHFERRLIDFIKHEAKHTQIDPVLLFDGPDHTTLDLPSYRILRDRLGPMDAAPGYELHHVSLDEHQQAMVAQADRISASAQGELLEPARWPLSADQQWLIGGTYASRVWIKQQNNACQAALCHWAEPWSEMSRTLRERPEAPGVMERAWRLLIANHAHDSICGCSIDEVHQDMAGRFRRVAQIADKSTQTSLNHIAGAIDAPLPEGEERLCLFNALPRADKKVHEVTLTIPTDWPRAEQYGNPGYSLIHFELIDEDDQPVHYQLLDERCDRMRAMRTTGRSPERLRGHTVRVAFEDEIPAMGYRTLRVRPADPDRPSPARFLGPGLAQGTRTLVNDRLRITAESDGTLTIEDRQSGQTYRGLMNFEDSGDIGDGWHFKPPTNNRTTGSVGSPATITLVEDGPLQATLEIEVRMRVPAEYDTAAQQRSEARVELRVVSRVTLRRGAGSAAVRTVVHNNAKDHRLRVMFPTDAAVKTYTVDAPFDVVNRRVGLPEDANDYREAPEETSPQQSWTAAFDGTRGLAVVAAGLMETCVRETPDRPIALTLLRANRRTAFTDGQPEGQLQGPLAFDLIIEPLADAPDVVALTEAGQSLNAGSQAVQLPGTHAHFWHQPAGLPTTGSGATLEGAVVLTSLRRVGDATEVRVYNPNPDPEAFTIKLNPFHRTPPREARPVNAESQPLGDVIDLKDATLHATLAPKQIATYRFSE